MSDEFDDTTDPLPRCARSRCRHRPPGPPGRAALRLREPGVRTRLVACLVRPLSPLGLAAVAAGAFTVVLSRSGQGGLSVAVAVADVARFSKEQIAELARFVEQVSPEALQQAAGLIADNALQRRRVHRLGRAAADARAAPCGGARAPVASPSGGGT